MSRRPRQRTDPAYRAALKSAAPQIVQLLLTGNAGCEALAVRLGVSKCFIQQIYGAATTPQQRRQAAIRKRGHTPWTAEHRQFVRDSAGKLSVPQIAARLNRTLTQVYQERNRLELCKHQPRLGEQFEAFLREKHALGWSDGEIATAWNCDRHAVGARRKALGLASNALSEHRRQCVREKTARQLADAGLPTLAALRVKAFRDRAVAAGWPADLRPRAVQILNTLWEQGPMTRREIADAIGMPWKGSRKSLHSNDAEGTYLAHLMKRGLVVSLGRVVRGQGKGKSVQVYSLPLFIERKVG